MKYTFDHTILLHLALQELGTTLGKYQARCYSRLQLAKATHMCDSETTYTSGDNITRISRESLWRTPTAVVKTTRYGRVKGVEWSHKPQPKTQNNLTEHPRQHRINNTQPTITIKRSKLRNGN